MTSGSRTSEPFRMGSCGVRDESKVREQEAASGPGSPPHCSAMFHFFSLAGSFLSLTLSNYFDVTLEEPLPLSDLLFLSVLQERGPICYFKNLQW